MILLKKTIAAFRDLEFIYLSDTNNNFDIIWLSGRICTHNKYSFTPFIWNILQRKSKSKKGHTEGEDKEHLQIK